jgi:hypothetical protein
MVWLCCCACSLKDLIEFLSVCELKSMLWFSGVICNMAMRALLQWESSGLCGTLQYDPIGLTRPSSLRVR